MIKFREYLKSWIGFYTKVLEDPNLSEKERAHCKGKKHATEEILKIAEANEYDYNS